jgi:galactokinase
VRDRDDDRSRSLTDLLRAHATEFRERFPKAGAPRLFFSPGRVNLMGAHLDYNGGPVIPTAIDRGTFFAVAPRADAGLRLESVQEAERFEGSLTDLPAQAAGRWSDYPLGVLVHVHRQTPLPSGVDVLVGGNLPIGAGLSSSASICVGTAFALDASFELGLTLQDKIDAALWGERVFVGVRCGIMDPFAVGHSRPGNLLWLDCKDASIEHVPFDSERVAIAVADSGVRRELAQGAFNERVAQCREAFRLLRPFIEDAECLRDVPLEVLDEHEGRLELAVRKRARHVLEEVRRTFAAREALLIGDLTRFGSAISAAHGSLRDLFEVSLPELDRLVESANAWDGVYGARLTGAGFGGCVVALLERGAEAGFAEHMSADFEARFGRRPRVEFFQGDAGPREPALG